MDGTLERKDGTVVVTVSHEPWSLDRPGVSCLNPSAPESERLYQKVFSQKKIYFPDEYELAIRENVRHPDGFALSMNGYSRITGEQCVRYGIQEGAYEEACQALMAHVIENLQSRFSGAQLRLVHGASDMGVDKAVQAAAEEFGIVPLGFSCPRYLLYVADDDMPVYVGSDKEEYSNRFIQSLDLLIATGGREQALQHNVLSACLYNKRIHFVDVLNSLSSTGGVPATVTGPDGRVRIDNAAAAMGRNVSFFTHTQAVQLAPQDGDLWDSIFDNVLSVATEACRYKMPPEKKFR